MAYLLLVVLILIPEFSRALRYSVRFDDEDVVKPCVNELDRQVSNWFDLSQFKIEFVSDDEINAYGNITSVYDFKPGDIINMHTTIHKQVRGEYKTPIADLKRKDFCPTLFAPQEVWYKFTSEFVKETRKCPPTLGWVWKINRASTGKMNYIFPDPSLAGSYRASVRLSLEDSEEYICYSLILNIERI